MSDLLLYVPPDQTVAEVIAAAAPPLVRVAPPIGPMPPNFTIRSTIAAYIHATTAPVITQQTGLGRATLHWLKTHDPPSQIHRSTLAALCASGVSLDALLVVTNDSKSE
jgi:DNA-binding Xre family transcriptional regulator